ncbi:glycosyltransferase family 2 protein [Pediococcus acidilactici]|uniref:glycosyltransferase family 2 protein n=1 Tax=Pediococcus acidilactici TaxID=1254 RepID=UPI00137C2FD9|nr:glycosyltransferase family 2 protein [Pediococcus acidilactici]QHS02340.1 glycosyltransferase family 2 protein [Pediococcus acidilactici]
MNDKVTIVIPIHNLEVFLRRCLESIRRQTYPYFEVLLVDDGSIDGSKEICKSFVEEDDRFKYFYQKNSGVSKARNIGIKKANGKYITFIDGDDFISPNHLQVMVEGLEDCQLSITGRNDIYEDNIRQVFKEDSDVYFDQKQVIDAVLKPGVVYSFPWNKMYLAEIIREKQILFDDGLKYGEDLVFNMEYILNIDKAILKCDTTYNYVYRSDSVSRLMNRETLKSRVTDILAIKQTIDLLPQNFEDEKYFLYKRIVVEGARYYRLLDFYNLEKKDLRRHLLFAYTKVSKYLTLKEKIIFLLNIKAPKLTFYITNKSK